MDVLQHFGFGEPIENVSPFVFINYRRVALISCKCHTCYNVETLTRQKHTCTHTTKRLYTLACRLYPWPENTHEGELGAAGDSPLSMCWGLFASQGQIHTAYILSTYHIVAIGMIFQQDVLKLPKNTCCSLIYQWTMNACLHVQGNTEILAVLLTEEHVHPCKLAWQHTFNIS